MLLLGFIGLTHWLQTRELAAPLATGVGALLEKPLDIPVLLEAMRRLLAEPIAARLARIAGKSPFPAPRTRRG